MKTCVVCRQDNPEHARYCGHCGSEWPAGIAVDRDATAPAAQELLPAAPLPDALRSLAPCDYPAPPKYLTVFGVINVILGLLLPVINYLFVAHSMQMFRDHGFSDRVILPLWVTIWTMTAVGLLLVLAGIGLLCHSLWGRILCILYAVVSVVGILVAFVCMTTTVALAQVEFEESSRSSEINERFIGAVVPSVLYGVLLVVMMFIAPTRDWVRGVRARKRGLPPEMVWRHTEAGGVTAPPVHPMAVLSLILSLVPFLLLTQIASVLTGIIALWKIGQSAGRVGGKAYAWTGVTISSVLLGCCGSIIGFAVFANLVLIPMDEAKRKQDRTNKEDYAPKQIGKEWPPPAPRNEAKKEW
jgi:hypothetical protein